MREFTIILSILIGYLSIIAIGFFAPSAYHAMFNQPITALHILKKKSELNDILYPPFFFREEVSDKQGVSVYKKEKTQDGYVFFVRADELGATLLNENGDVVHSWHKTPREIWGDKNPYVNEIPERLHTVIRGFLEPETGSAFLLYGGFGITPQNIFGLAKLDKDSNIIWSYDGYAHHDIEVTPDGHVYVLGRNMIMEGHPDFPTILPPIHDDEIVVLDNNGKLVKKVSLFDLFAKSDLKVIFELMTHIPVDPILAPGDVLHANTIEYITAQAAGKAPMLKEGHIMVSFRNLDLLAIIDMDKEEITWASYGPWEAQHHPEILDDGTMILFDNQGHLGPGGASRTLHVDLNDLSVLWEYSGTKNDPFFSKYSGAVEALPNSNVLVSDSMPGRIFEVTRDKEIVWEYWVPNRVTSIDNESLIPSVFSAEKFSVEELQFLKP